MDAARALGERLKALRQEAGLSQVELASRSGLSRAYLAALERGLSSATKAPPRPSGTVLMAIARALGLDPMALRGLPLPQPPSTSPSALVGLDGSEWAWPEADAVITVEAGVAPDLGLQPGDVVLVRHWHEAGWPEGLCLYETGKSRHWARVALISGRPYASAPDGSYRPLLETTRAIAVAIALVRPLKPS